MQVPHFSLNQCYASKLEENLDIKRLLQAGVHIPDLLVLNVGYRILQIHPSSWWLNHPFKTILDHFPIIFRLTKIPPPKKKKE